MRKVFKTIKSVSALFFLCLIPFNAVAQSGINSPYSRYGVGLLSDHSTGVTKSMGGIGAGFRQNDAMNLKNPASYSAVDSLTFIADLGFALQNGNYSENGIKINARNMYMNHMAMQFRVLPKVGMTVHISAELVINGVQTLHEFLIFRQLYHAVVTDDIQQHDRVGVSAMPSLRIDVAE